MSPPSKSTQATCGNCWGDGSDLVRIKALAIVAITPIKNKMTGAFHDFSKSSGGEEHPLIDWFKEAVEQFVPSKKRELPEWALNIFSGSMIAAGNSPI